VYELKFAVVFLHVHRWLKNSFFPRRVMLIILRCTYIVHSRNCSK